MLPDWLIRYLDDPRQLGLLSTVRNSLTVHAAERVFTTMILPKLDYCDFIWNNFAPYIYKTLERLQTALVTISCCDN